MKYKKGLLASSLILVVCTQAASSKPLTVYQGYHKEFYPIATDHHKVEVIRDFPTQVKKEKVNLNNQVDSKPKTILNYTNEVKGEASWYCKRGRSACHKDYPDRSGTADLYAAAGPALRKGNWRGRIVTVQANDRKIKVKLVDWCGCPSRIIDLYFDSFAALGYNPYTKGVMQVVITW